MKIWNSADQMLETDDTVTWDNKTTERVKWVESGKCWWPEDDFSAKVTFVENFGVNHGEA
jgi:hypothetical protein